MEPRYVAHRLLKHLADQRGRDYCDVDLSTSLNWNKLRRKVRERGMRNSNVMAIAPTATIANIVGVSQSIEPTYQNLYVKSNLSGEFTVVNPYMVRDLKQLGLWDKVMANDLNTTTAAWRRSVAAPPEVKSLYATAFEVEPRYLVDAASRRQKWIDQAQSLNLYIANASGKKLDITYRMAWLRGLKTTYYLRSLSATSTEKSTLERPGNTLNAVSAVPALETKATPVPMPALGLGTPAPVPSRLFHRRPGLRGMPVATRTTADQRRRKDMLSWDEIRKTTTQRCWRKPHCSPAKPSRRPEPLLAAESMTDATPLAVDVAVPPLATSITSAAISAAALFVGCSARRRLQRAVADRSADTNSNTAIGI